jgi:diadenosine tetraphosphatase ApaH/serine/threonine PP2A family protein phosphatase
MAPLAVRHVFIGDVHGCLDELEALIRKVRVGPADRVVFVGDLVAKGPDSAGVVACARELKALSVRGNHDEAVLRIRRARKGQGGDLSRAKKTHLRVAETLCEADWRWLEPLPLWLRFPAFDSVVVHAGVVPGKPLNAQRPEDLMTMRTMRPDGHASPRLEDGLLWAKAYRGPERIIFGHDAISGFQREEFAVGLDTGCVYGRELTALVLPSNELFSVPARRTYREIGP